jgi:peroxiredoxin
MPAEAEIMMTSHRMRKNILFILTFLFAKTCFCQADYDSSFLMINFKAEATIKVDFRNFRDTVFLSSYFGNFFPNDDIKGPQKKLYGDGTEYVTLKIQIPQKIELDFSGLPADSSGVSAEADNPTKEIYITCFLVPFDTLIIDLDYAKLDQQNQSVLFHGKYAEVSKYYQDKATYFPGIDFIYQHWMLANTITDLNSFKNATDSITNVELNFLSEYCLKNKLPEWFTDYESSDIHYFGYGGKLREPFFMKYSYGSAPQVPVDYYSFTKDLPLENEKAILSIYYYESLRDYFMMVWEPAKYKTTPFGKFSSPNSRADFVEYSTSQYNPYISDILIARDLDMLIDLNHINEDDYIMIIKSINDSSLKNYLEQRYENRERLKKGDNAPDFYLKNESDEYLSLKNFKDSIVYISFWMTGCKPCIKEFPEENRLVDIFKNEKVKIISICMDTKEEDWKYLVMKYQLKTINLFATGNWEKMLKENYDISGFPHYVLIDKENKIVENKCIYPSQGAEQLIRNLLNK